MQPDRVLKNLGTVLRELREDRGLSQEQLSLRTGVHRNYIGGIERGERSPSVAVMAELADALDTSLSSLFRLAEQAAGRKKIA